MQSIGPLHRTTESKSAFSKSPSSDWYAHSIFRSTVLKSYYTGSSPVSHSLATALLCPFLAALPLTIQ